MKKSAFWRMTEQTLHMNDSQFQEWLRALSYEDLKEIATRSWYIYEASSLIYDQKINHHMKGEW